MRSDLLPSCRCGANARVTLLSYRWAIATDFNSKPTSLAIVCVTGSTKAESRRGHVDGNRGCTPVARAGGTFYTRWMLTPNEIVISGCGGSEFRGRLAYRWHSMVATYSSVIGLGPPMTQRAVPNHNVA